MRPAPEVPAAGGSSAMVTQSVEPWSPAVWWGAPENAGAMKVSDEKSAEVTC